MGLIRAVWSAVTWQRVLVAQSIAVSAVLVRSLLHKPLELLAGHPGLNYLTMCLIALFLLPLTVFTDELVTRGARVRPVYSFAVAISFPLALIVTWIVQSTASSWLSAPAAATEAHHWACLSNGVDAAIVYAIGMLIYLNRRTAERMLSGIQAAELRRVRLARQLIESRLATTQAQVDPKILLSDLALIREAFRSADPGAEDKLDRLVQHLRSALARTTDTSKSSLPRAERETQHSADPDSTLA